jgi:hypothetical protein
LRHQSLLMRFKSLGALLRVFEVVTLLMSGCGRQGRPGATILFGIAAIVEIGLRLHLRVGRGAG